MGATQQLLGGPASLWMPMHPHGPLQSLTTLSSRPSPLFLYYSFFFSFDLLHFFSISYHFFTIFHHFFFSKLLSYLLQLQSCGLFRVLPSISPIFFKLGFYALTQGLAQTLFLFLAFRALLMQILRLVVWMWIT